MIPQYILDLVFYPIIYRGETYYWRECVMQYEDIEPGTNGYILIYPDGQHIHTYHHPEYMIEDWEREDRDNQNEQN